MSDELFGNGEADKQYDDIVNFDAAVFRTLLAQLERAEEKEASARGDKGSAMKKIEDADFDKWAFKAAKQLVNMTPTKAQDRIACLLGYCLINGTFDQLNLFSRDEVHTRIKEIVAILNDRAGEVGLDIQLSDDDDEYDTQDESSDAEYEAEDDSGDCEEGDTLAADGADGVQVADDDGAEVDAIDDMPENSGEIFNSGKQCAIDEGDIDDCPHDGRTKEAAIWKRGFNSAMSDLHVEDDEDAEVPAGMLGEDEPFPGDDAHVH
ncbi:hypothetical protein [Terasakiella sp.]|uniref:hypothetical protein n=1 Tax=Terasakiella sp. TaxID=2034861 RepID=UPI003AA86F0A